MITCVYLTEMVGWQDEHPRYPTCKTTLHQKSPKAVGRSSVTPEKQTMKWTVVCNSCPRYLTNALTHAKRHLCHLNTNVPNFGRQKKNNRQCLDMVRKMLSYLTVRDGHHQKPKEESTCKNKLRLEGVWRNNAPRKQQYTATRYMTQGDVVTAAHQHMAEIFFYQHFWKKRMLKTN